MRKRTASVLPAVLVAAMLPLMATPAALAVDSALAGTWRIDRQRSEPMQRGGEVIENTLAVALDDEDVLVERTFYREGQERTFSFTYVTDGKPHAIQGPLGSRDVRATWKKNRLVLSYTLSRDTPRGPFDIDVTETWRVDKNDELIIEYASRMQDRPMVRKEIYTRIKGDG